MKIKTAEEIYEEHGCSKKSEILEAMKEYASQFIDEALEAYYYIQPEEGSMIVAVDLDDIREIKKQIK